MEGETIMAHQPEHIWRYRDIDVMYEFSVDGGGMRMAPPLIDFIQKRFGPDRRFRTVFEWCSGPAFIGFALLAEGMCDSLCLADVNPTAIQCANRTIKTNKLHDRVRAYVSDNMGSIPSYERFDLVVGNPPSFCTGNPKHPGYSQFHGNIIGHDPDWRIHAGFYSEIAQFLESNALILVLEVNLYEREVFTPECSVPIDIRPQEPQLTFDEMIRRGGLTHIENAAFDPGWQVGLNFWVQISQNTAGCQHEVTRSG
jgi:hypothetical protein